MKMAGLLLTPLFALAFYVHWVGFDRGASDFVPPEREGAVFYNFHPDEETLIRAALALENPFEPTLTSYGALPVYLLKIALVGHEVADLATALTAAQIYRKARLLALLIALANLLVLYFLARRFAEGAWSLLPPLLLAFSPLAIQQAHFYTVDGLFALLSLLALWCVLGAAAGDSRRLYVLAALLVGCAGAVRLNGLLLGVILLAAHFVRVRENVRRNARENVRGNLREIVQRWLALPALCGLVALVALVALEPYLLSDPSLLWQQRWHGDFSFSLGIAKGDVLQTWTLVDVHTTAYLHYLTALLPLAMGWPLALVALVALVYAGWKGSREKQLLVLWCALYFALVGGLHTKPVRYLMPLLPLLALFAADWCRTFFSRRRNALIFSGALVLCTLVQGLFFARIYAVEDARIQAARWLAKEVPNEAKIGLEKGAFTLHKLVDGQRTADLNILHLFYTGPYMLCAQQVDYMRVRADQLDYIALITANRQRQFTAVPELYPVVADFYTRLLVGEMGYKEVARFAYNSSLFNGDIDPSFTGYDHPTVLIFKREVEFAAAFERWRRDIASNRHCGDGDLAGWASALKSQELASARVFVERADEIASASPLAQVLAASTFHRLGDSERARRAELRYEYPGGHWAHLRKSPTAHRVPASTAASLLGLGLVDLAVDVLKEGVGNSVFYPFGALADMADTYMAVAQQLLAQEEIGPMQEVLALSLQLYEKPAAYNTLARIAYFAHDYVRADSLWRRSLALDPAQAVVRASLDEMAARATQTEP